MDVQIAPGQPERLEEYLEILRDSALYEHYYAPDEERTLLAGFRALDARGRRTVQGLLELEKNLPNLPEHG